MKTEVEESVAKKAFDIIKKNTNIFDGWTTRSITGLLSYMKVLSFQKYSLDSLDLV